MERTESTVDTQVIAYVGEYTAPEVETFEEWEFETIRVSSYCS